MTNTDKAKLDKAIYTSIDAHHGQKYGSFAYDFHLNHVCEILIKFGILDIILLVSAWLHDIIEDTEWTKEDVEREFGNVVAQLVDNVTDAPGKNRKERKAKTFIKIIKDKRSVLLKLADRIANVKHSLKVRSKHLSMYVNEHEEFSLQLRNSYDDPTLTKMFIYLDGLVAKAKELT